MDREKVCRMELCFRLRQKRFLGEAAATEEATKLHILAISCTRQGMISDHKQRKLHLLKTREYRFSNIIYIEYEVLDRV